MKATSFLFKFICLSPCIVLCNTTWGEVIYSNLGFGCEFSAAGGWSISYEQGYSGQAVAQSFVAGTDALVGSVDVPVYVEWFPPETSTAFDVGIYQDDGGKPGTLLGFATGEALRWPEVPSINDNRLVWNNPPESLVRVEFTYPVQVVAGTKYWIGVHPSEAVLTLLGWFWNHELEANIAEMWANHGTSVFVGDEFENAENAIVSAFQINDTAEGPSVCAQETIFLDSFEETQ